jgi:hypothetical protein
LETGLSGAVLERTGSGSLAALAEEQRRGGDAFEALRMAEDALERDAEDVAARATAVLAALDLGDEARARSFLEPLVAVAAPLGFESFEETEIDGAFAEAEPETAAMRDANAVAYDAIRAAALDTPEGVATPEPESPFQTRTMAALLERQGDAAGAESIRSAIARRESETSVPMRSGRRHGDRIRILERWLGRVRRGDA